MKITIKKGQSPSLFEVMPNESNLRKAKNIHLIILLGALCLLSVSCNDWLDVSPRSETKEVDLYSTEDGFKSSLTGAYIQLADRSLYGRNTTMYLPDIMAWYWTIPSSTTDLLYLLTNYDFESATSEALVSAIWQNYYTVIAQLNSILNYIENTAIDFSYDNDKLIKGEALGLRAFLHLDLLRFFGPVPGLARPGDITIPYMKEMTRDVSSLVSISWQDVVTYIEKDLNDAEEILKGTDPVLFYANSALNAKKDASGIERPDDSWQLNRQNRFNYYAVLGAKSRFYHWTGDGEKSVYYAKQVVEAVNENGSSKFTLATESTYTSASDLVMYSEHLFSLHNPGHQDIVSSLFEGKSAVLKQLPEYVGTAYESTVHPDDIRNKSDRYWKQETYINSEKVNHFFKYTGNGTISASNVVPVLRLSELYFILMENCSLGEAAGYFSTWRISRSLNSILETDFTDSNSVLSRLEKEYRKEFWGEGQMFFFYKKHGYEEYSWPGTIKLTSLDYYVIPKPKNQIDYENYD